MNCICCVLDEVEEEEEQGGGEEGGKGGEGSVTGLPALDCTCKTQNVKKQTLNVFFIARTDRLPCVSGYAYAVIVKL